MMKKTSSGFTFIGLLVVLAIIAFLVIKAMDVYYGKPSMDKKTQKVMSEQGIDTTDYVSIKDSLKNKLENINRDYQEKMDKIEQKLK